MILRKDSWSKKTGRQGTLFHQGWSLRTIGIKANDKGEGHTSIQQRRKTPKYNKH